MSQLELGSIANDAVEALQEDGITVRRILVGSFMVRTSLLVHAGCLING
jgi:dihydroxyacetone kinase